MKIYAIPLIRVIEQESQTLGLTIHSLPGSKGLMSRSYEEEAAAAAATWLDWEDGGAQEESSSELLVLSLLESGPVAPELLGQPLLSRLTGVCDQALQPKQHSCN